MKRLLVSLLVSILTFFSLIFPGAAFAEENINKFGIHILETPDLNKASELVNSSGGDWGWVTIVIRDDDINFEKWQDFMDECRERHLVPLVRIATHNENSHWVKPRFEDSQIWADFLGSLNWPTQDQHVIIFNEPNHAKEWGGEINPKEYAKILLEYSEKLKAKSEKFKILNAGLDLAAPNGKETVDALRFMREMRQELPDIFEKLDGWCSHSYPNYGFVGKPWESGRVSIKGYEWELWVLKNHLGLKKQLPVFIAETGWPKNSSKLKVKSAKLRYYDEKTTAEFLKQAFENVWLKDKRVKAITPFVLNYPQELFAPFSWFDKEGNPAPQYETVKSLPKQSWWPKQEDKYEIKTVFLPSFLPTNQEFKGKITIKNTGQAIWGEKGSVELPATTSGGLLISNLILTDSKKVKPGEIIQADFTINSTDSDDIFEFTWGELPKFELKVLPSSIITTTKYSLWEKMVLKIKEAFGV